MAKNQTEKALLKISIFLLGSIWVLFEDNVKYKGFVMTNVLEYLHT